MKIQLHKTDTVTILGVLALVVMVLIVIGLAAQKTVLVPVTGLDDGSQVSVAPILSASTLSVVNKPIEEYTPTERQLFQITEEYPYTPITIDSMNPHERERLQITEYYP